MAKRRLTTQQKTRIARIQDKRRERLADRVEASLDQAEGEHHSGRVIVRHGQSLTVETDSGRRIRCLFRQNLGDVVCGDLVVWQPTGDDEGVVVAVQERASALSRPDYSGHDKAIAANITQLVVVLAPEPPPSGFLLDQYLVAAEQIGVRGLICLNKADLLDPAGQAAFRADFAHYARIGYPLVQISAKREHGLGPLLAELRGHTSILVGQSGVGKSSLINALLPHHVIEEGRLSESTGLGRHTTSAATLYRLDSGGEMIDSPGVRSFRLGRIERRDLEHGYPEFRSHLGHCGFRNCAHEAEPECAIRDAVERGTIDPRRLTSFHQLVAQIPDEQY